MLIAVFLVVLLLMVLRSRLKRRSRPATGADVRAAAQVDDYSSYQLRPHRRDPSAGGRRDWGQ